jgi:hypothetical protein
MISVARDLDCSLEARLKTYNFATKSLRREEKYLGFLTFYDALWLGVFVALLFDHVSREPVDNPLF